MSYYYTTASLAHPMIHTSTDSTNFQCILDGLMLEEIKNASHRTLLLLTQQQETWLSPPSMKLVCVIGCAGAVVHVGYFSHQ